MGDINGLPVGVFVILCGVGVVLLAWVVMRFGGKIVKGLLAVAGVGIGAVVAVAIAVQSFANVQQSKATVQVAKAAQTANTSNLLLVGVVGCVGGFAVVAVLALVGVALYLWYKLRIEEQRQARPRPAMLPQVAQPVQVAEGDFDLAWLEGENWVERGEQLWAASDSFHW